MPIAGGRGDRQSRHHHSTDMANLTNTFAIPARHAVIASIGIVGCRVEPVQSSLLARISSLSCVSHAFLELEAVDRKIVGQRMTMQGPTMKSEADPPFQRFELMRHVFQVENRPFLQKSFLFYDLHSSTNRVRRWEEVFQKTN